MVYYVRQGIITESRHTYDDSKHILKEELFGEESFDGPYSLLYHEREPTRVKSIRRIEKPHLSDGSDDELRHRHLKGFQVKPHGDFISGRTCLMFNDDVEMGLIKPQEQMSCFFRSAIKEQLFFVQKGEGEMKSSLGTLKFSRGDYISIPKGTTYEMKYGQGSEFFYVESRERMGIPARYLNIYGQIKEGSPYYSRDIRHPTLGKPNLEDGNYRVLVDFGDYYLEETRDQHPFDVAGWDGYLFPWAINVSLMAPIVGRLHQPPPVHETFSSKSFMVGTFLPRKYDFHPRAIPISYYHSNIDTDEVLFYSSGNFMSRKGISEGSLTLHVRGLIHGPQPGAVQGAIGKEGTDEVAVMVEAYRPLKLTKEAKAIEDSAYMSSWYA